MTGAFIERRAERVSWRQCVKRNWSMVPVERRPLGFGTRWWPFVVEEALERICVADAAVGGERGLVRCVVARPDRRRRKHDVREQTHECGTFLLDP